MRHSVILVAGCALALAACDTNSAGQSESREGAPAEQAQAAKGEAQVELISAQELAKLVEANKVVLTDVRTPEEFAEKRLAGGLNAPLQSFAPASIPQEDSRETILYCRSGNRSGQAAAQLSAYLGRPVRHLDGGISAWESAGLPTIAQP